MKKLSLQYVVTILTMITSLNGAEVKEIVCQKIKNYITSQMLINNMYNGNAEGLYSNIMLKEKPTWKTGDNDIPTFPAILVPGYKEYMINALINYCFIPFYKFQVNVQSEGLAFLGANMQAESFTLCLSESLFEMMQYVIDNKDVINCEPFKLSKKRLGTTFVFYIPKELAILIIDYVISHELRHAHKDNNQSVTFDRENDADLYGGFHSINSCHGAKLFHTMHNMYSLVYDIFDTKIQTLHKNSFLGSLYPVLMKTVLEKSMMLLNPITKPTNKELEVLYYVQHLQDTHIDNHHPSMTTRIKNAEHMLKHYEKQGKMLPQECQDKSIKLEIYSNYTGNLLVTDYIS